MSLRVSVQLSEHDADTAPITVIGGTSGEFPSIDLEGDRIHLMPAPGNDLPAALRRLADRVDDAMVTFEPKAVA